LSLTGELTVAFGIKNVNKLYRLVQNWYQLHPGSSIPLDAWSRKLEVYDIARGDTLSIETPEYTVEFESSWVIPLFAAVSLGATTEHLAKIIEHHGVRMGDLSNCSYAHTQTLMAPDNTKIPISPHHVTDRAVEAFATLPEFAGMLAQSALRKMVPLTDQVRASLLKIDVEAFWPNTQIERCFNAFESSQEWGGSVPHPSIFPVFKSGFEDFATFTDEKIRELLFRAGVLNPRVCRENDFDDAFFRNVFQHARISDKSARCIVRALNSVENEAERSIISQKLVLAFSENESPLTKGIEVASFFFSLVDHDKYPEVINSLILRLNLAPETVINEFREYPSIMVPEHVVPSSVLETLSKELLATKPEDMRWQHFRSLQRLAMEIKTPQELHGFDLPELITHMMHGYQAHTSTERIADKALVAQVTHKSISAFLSYASKLAEPDYERLSTLDSESKALMAVNGFSMKKLSPGMSNLDKGRVLCEGLGL
jgi:hypothetical protein